MKFTSNAIEPATGIVKGIATGIEVPRRTARTAADYSHVSSLEIARALVRQGMLFEITLFPEEFGGTREAYNLIYVPPGIPEMMDLVIETLLSLRNDGLVDQLSMDVEYKGKSFVPGSISVRATHNCKSRTFEPRIGIW
jgi:hypothetical protein